jgi:hypothetical protein
LADKVGWSIVGFAWACCIEEPDVGGGYFVVQEVLAGQKVEADLTDTIRVKRL